MLNADEIMPSPADVKVSVIIPIYNGSDYIDNIFSRIKAQSMKDLEVIFINDGSTDDSEKVINRCIREYEGEAYEAKVRPKFRLISQENTGQGGARNRGIIEAKGEYLVFLDQDDYIRDDYLGRLLEVIEKTGADLVISGYEHVTSAREVKEHVELVNNEWCRFMNITPWGKIYRRAFVVDKGIRFLPVPLGEDIYFNVLCYSSTDKVAYTNYVGYQWVINEASVSNTVHRSVSSEANVLGLFDSLAGMSTAHKWMKDPQFEYFCLKTGIFHILYAAKGTPYSELIRYEKDIFSWLNMHMSGIERNTLISLRKPAGERWGVQCAVYFFMLFRRLHLDGVFLRLFCRMS